MSLTVKVSSFDKPGDVEGYGAPMPLIHLLNFLPWSQVLDFSNCVFTNTGFNYNDHGFQFPDEAKEFGENISGVKVFDPFEEIIMSDEDFRSNVHFFLKKIISNAEKSNSSQIKTDWWAQLKENSDKI
jgi:hypothetical protein